MRAHAYQKIGGEKVICYQLEFGKYIFPLFSELKLVTDNLLSFYAAANWEATEKIGGYIRKAINTDILQPYFSDLNHLTICWHTHLNHQRAHCK